MKRLLLPFLILCQLACGKDTVHSEVYETITVADMDGMRAATLELRPDGQYYFTLKLLGQTVTGTYERKNEKLLLKPTDGVTSLGTWCGDTLEVNGLKMLPK